MAVMDPAVFLGGFRDSVTGIGSAGAAGSGSGKSKAGDEISDGELLDAGISSKSTSMKSGSGGIGVSLAVNEGLRFTVFNGVGSRFLEGILEGRCSFKEGGGDRVSDAT